MGHGDLDADDARQQVPLVGVEDGPRLRGHHRDAARAARKYFEARVERTVRKPLVGRFGRIPLRRDERTVINDRRLAPVNTKRKELVTRLLAGRCEACRRIDEVEVHHVAKLADLGRPGDRPPWADLMAARHRKTLVVCSTCHADIHGRKPVAALTEWSLESDVR
ncbi:hypothetical protein [Streptomyces sp. NPDC052036]|uniref:HNH endonuclease n=1 Tax=Streptomyces sp. NPDC052036 TaxID=3155171 RepID=UPI003440746F